MVPIPEPEGDAFELAPSIKMFFHFIRRDWFPAIPLLGNHLQGIGIDRDEIMPSEDHQQIGGGIRSHAVKTSTTLCVIPGWAGHSF